MPHTTHSKSTAPKPIHIDAIHLHTSDNVAIAARPLQANTTIEVAGQAIHLNQPISQGHKIAVRPIPAGDRVTKYGQTIGFTTSEVQPGDWVHTHNMHAGEFQRDYAFSTEVPPDPAPITGRTFMGYRRPDGRVGTRNYIGIVSTVNCSASVSKYITRAFDQSILDDYPHVDGIVPLTHSTGCGMAGSGSLHYEQLTRTLAGFAKHPNIGAYIVIGLGCEVANAESLIREQGLTHITLRGENLQSAESNSGDSTNAPIHMTIQESGGTRKTVERGVAQINSLLPLVNQARRVEVPAGELILGTECGGSDGNSGITANPALGIAGDRLVACGGTSILAETPEVYGAEHLLTRRAKTPEVGRKLIELIKWWEWYTSTFDVKIDNNPSPGNKAGGLTTIYEKSLGAVAKGGHSALAEVYRYAEPVTAKGFVFMDTPGFDPPSVTGMVAGGANIICFTTGRGSCYGCKPVPSIKICTNTETYNRLSDDMDINAGVILEGATVEQVGQQIFDTILDVASGQKTKSEIHGIGDEEFIPWQIGPVL